MLGLSSSSSSAVLVSFFSVDGVSIVSSVGLSLVWHRTVTSSPIVTWHRIQNTWISFTLDGHLPPRARLSRTIKTCNFAIFQCWSLRLSCIWWQDLVYYRRATHSRWQGMTGCGPGPILQASSLRCHGEVNYVQRDPISAEGRRQSTAINHAASCQVAVKSRSGQKYSQRHKTMTTTGLMRGYAGIVCIAVVFG